MNQRGTLTQQIKRQQNGLIKDLISRKIFSDVAPSEAQDINHLFPFNFIKNLFFCSHFKACSWKLDLSYWVQGGMALLNLRVITREATGSSVTQVQTQRSTYSTIPSTKQANVWTSSPEIVDSLSGMDFSHITLLKYVHKYSYRKKLYFQLLIKGLIT